MAILDKKLEFSDAQSFVSSSQVGYSYGSTNAINLGTGYNCWGDTAYNEIGEGGNLYFNARVATTFTPAGTTLTIKLQTGTSAAIAILTSTATVLGTWEITNNGVDMAAGKTLVRAAIPAASIRSMLQYLGVLYYESSGAAASVITAGAIDAWISMDSESELPRS